MFGKIFSVKTDIVYRREESLNLFKGKKNLIRWCPVGFSENKSSCLVSLSEQSIFIRFAAHQSI